MSKTSYGNPVGIGYQNSKYCCAATLSIALLLYLCTKKVILDFFFRCCILSFLILPVSRPLPEMASGDGFWSSKRLLPVAMPALEEPCIVIAFENSRWSPRWAVEEPHVWLFEVPAGPKGLSTRTTTMAFQDLFENPLLDCASDSPRF